MSVKAGATRKSKTSGLDEATINEAFGAAMEALKKPHVPQDSSCRSTVAGQVAAAKRCGSKLKKFL
ncbi:MAG: hypothetical protein LBC59_05155 [Chitinispirillales bacterium]|jgi:hypothetical protein|nr:hypothetical protein [Chitinispirillales bacterium]